MSRQKETLVLCLLIGLTAYCYGKCDLQSLEGGAGCGAHSAQQHCRQLAAGMLQHQQLLQSIRSHLALIRLQKLLITCRSPQQEADGCSSRQQAYHSSQAGVPYSSKASAAVSCQASSKACRAALKEASSKDSARASCKASAQAASNASSC
jgi:hypothetical protein